MTTRILFIAEDEAHGRELWVSDGTRDGTGLLKDIHPGPEGSYPLDLTPVGDGRAVFHAWDGIGVAGLWITDGTAAGTELVRRFTPPDETTHFTFGPRDFAALDDGRILFSAAEGTGGRQLWLTDTTEAGTGLVAVLNPTGGAAPRQITPLEGGQALFVADDGGWLGLGRLWMTDGTEAGTLRLDEAPVAGGVGPLTPLGDGRFIFTAFEQDPCAELPAGSGGRELWITDATPGGTTLLRDLMPEPWTASSHPQDITPLGDGRAVFHIAAAEPGAGTRHLAVTDGTPAGTTTLDVRVLGWGPMGPLGDGRAVFAGHDDANGFELWVSDGTAEGTARLRDIFPGPASSEPHAFTALDDGVVLFSARTRVPAGTDPETGEPIWEGIGQELWITDGTAEGTELVRRLDPGPFGSWPGEITPLGDGRAVFTAFDQLRGHEVWITNGTASGTAQLAAAAWPAEYTVLQAGPAEPPPQTVTLTGMVLDRGGAGLAETSVTFAPLEGAAVAAMTAADGRFALTLPADGAGHLAAARAHAPEDPAITTAAALEALRLAVGLAPSWGPPSALDYLAADFDGDGQVTTADALEILRVAVGLPADHAPRWIFLDPDADLAGIGRDNAQVAPGHDLPALAADMAGIEMLGILVGNLQDHA